MSSGRGVPVRHIDRVAVLAEFDGPGALVEAARRLRDEGYELLDAFTPRPVEELEEVLAIRRTRLPWFALACGVAGGAFAYGLQWWINVVDFPLNVGGRPLHAAPAFIPITFETVILCASVGVFVAFFWRSGLPALWQPVFEVEGFERASADRFWIAVDRRDGRFDPEATPALLAGLEAAPSRVLVLDEEGRVLDERRPGGEPGRDEEGGEQGPGGREGRG